MARDELLQAARSFLATCEPEHPVQDLLNIDSPSWGSSDLVLANPARTRLHIARFCLGGSTHEFFMDSVAFGCWFREMLGVSTRIFRTSATFTLYLFAPRFPESCRALLSPISGMFQVELLPFVVVPVQGRRGPLIHLLRETSCPSSRVDEVWTEPVPVLPESGQEEEPPAGLTAEEIAEFDRLERLYFGR